MNYSINTFTGASEAPACSSCSCTCRCRAYTTRATLHRDGQRGGEIFTMKIGFPSLCVSKLIFFKNWNINLILFFESFPMLFTDFKKSSCSKSYEQKTAKFYPQKMVFPCFWVSKWIFFKKWNINLILLLKSFPMLFTDFKNSNSIKSYEQKTAKYHLQ